MAFNYCETLTSIIIGNGVTTIGDAVFNNCGNLERIIVNAGNPVYDSRENCNAIIETSSNTLISGCKNTIIPNSVTAIGDGAFFGCRGLTSISIPNSVTQLGNEVFGYCIALKHIAVETGNPIYDSRDNCNAIIATSSNTLITGCKNTVIPDDVTAIGYCAFRLCYGLTTVTIPNSVTEVSHAACYACIGLKVSYCLAESVPTTSWDVFTKVELADVTLHVPTTSLEAYSTEYPWSDFGQIVAIGEGDGIEQLISEEGNPAFANPTVYDLNGCRTAKMQKGINLLRSADGRVRKVIRSKE